MTARERRITVGRMPMFGGAVHELITVEGHFMRSVLRDALRACEADAAQGDPEAPDFVAEYRDALALLDDSQTGTRRTDR